MAIHIHSQRPDWLTMTELMLKIHGDYMSDPSMVANVDQGEMGIRDSMGTIGVDLDDEWAVFNMLALLVVMQSMDHKVHDKGLSDAPRIDPFVKALVLCLIPFVPEDVRP